MATKAGVKTPIKVPFDGEGNLIDYPYQTDHSRAPAKRFERCDKDTPGALDSLAGYWYRYVPDGEWRDNYVFEATMTITGIERGRSAARFKLEDDRGHKYIMFMTDMLEMIRKAETIAYGMVEARWTFTKRGANYGVKLA